MCGRIVFNFNAFHNALSLIKLFKNKKKVHQGLYPCVLPCEVVSSLLEQEPA